MRKIIKVDLMTTPSYDEKWEPLIDLIGGNIRNQFMFMGAVVLEDGTVIFAYKHVNIRYYVNLSADDKLWLYDVGERGYYQFEADREHIRTVIRLGGNPFVIDQFGDNGKITGYIYQGECYCSSCIQEQASVGGEIVLVPLYGDETALNKKCLICDEMIHGGLRNESTEAIGEANRVCEVADDQPQLA